MKKTFTGLFATAALALGMAVSAHAAESVLAIEDVGKQVPVIQTEKVTVTQVVVGDANQSFLMTTEQNVQDQVVVTPEMAKNALPFRIALDSLPPVTSDKQVHNAGKTVVGNKVQFSQTGRFEPMTVIPTDVSKLYFQYGQDIYFVETTSAQKPSSLELNYDLMAMATKLN